MGRWLRRRLPARDLGVAVASVAFTWPARCLVRAYVTPHEVGALIATLLAVVGAFLLVAIVDWVLWADTTRERDQTNLALRKWELTTGDAVGRVTSTRSPRSWWRPLHHWWLMRRRRGR